VPALYFSPFSWKSVSFCLLQYITVNRNLLPSKWASCLWSRGEKVLQSWEFFSTPRKRLVWRNTVFQRCAKGWTIFPFHGVPPCPPPPPPLTPQTRHGIKTGLIRRGTAAENSTGHLMCGRSHWRGDWTEDETCRCSHIPCITATLNATAATNSQTRERLGSYNPYAVPDRREVCMTFVGRFYHVQLFLITVFCYHSLSSLWMSSENIFTLPKMLKLMIIRITQRKFVAEPWSCE
jgi:hypothetical protein